MSTRVALATANEGKRKELAELVVELDWDLTLPDSAVMRTIEESGKTFIENALIKARTVAQATGLPTLADDSGLVVPALQGRPGIHSARYAGEHGNDEKNNRKLLKDLRDMRSPDQRRAAFVCVLVYIQTPNDPLPEIGMGKWHGSITQDAAGSGGFGYDPLFYLPELECSVAELSEAKKNRLSHRYRAWISLKQGLHHV